MYFQQISQLFWEILTDEEDTRDEIVNQLFYF